jgi:uncharacterized protein (TIGR02001 family)
MMNCAICRILSHLLVYSYLVIGCAAPSAQAEDTIKLGIPGTFSATAGIASEYVFRGITQSNEEPALQGSIDYSTIIGSRDGNEIGLYAGIWGSNVEFNDNNEASTEFDFYTGITHDIADISFDIGAIYYAYPGAAANLNYDFWEVKFATGYDFGPAEIGGSVYYSPDYFGGSGDAVYYQAAAEVPLEHGIYLAGHVGRQKIDDNVAYTLPDYTDWSIGLGANIEGFDINLSYIDTNISKSRCADGCDSKAVLTLSRSF